MIHPARAMKYEDLYIGLQYAVTEGLVHESIGEQGLRLYVYTEACVYDRLWNPITELARGLILDVERKEVVATPFPKFFNHGERLDIPLPELPFEAYEKLDGSLIIVFFHNNEWKTATKGSFKSDQAKWALNKLKDYDVDNTLQVECTYLFEAIYPENRIVIKYDYTHLVLLAVYHSSGQEFGYRELVMEAEYIGCPLARRHPYKSLDDLLKIASSLPANDEGFVIRFDNGHRIKIKGDEYCRIHRLISRLSPLSVWDSMKNQDDLEAIRKQLPEEFWADFDLILQLLEAQLQGIVNLTEFYAKGVEEFTDKQVGLTLDTFPSIVRKFIFPFRKNKGDLFTGRSREQLFRAIRPDSNILEGYTPSSSINRVQANA